MAGNNNNSNSNSSRHGHLVQVVDWVMTVDQAVPVACLLSHHH